jgi:hypothetical protein
VSSIRAYKEEDRFIKILEERVNVNTVGLLMTEFCTNWLTIRLDFISSFISFFVGAVAGKTSNNEFSVSNPTLRMVATVN